MRQIEIADNYTRERRGGRLFQTFYIDNSQDFPYYRPLYLIVAEDEAKAAQAGKNQYFLDNMSRIKSTDYKAKVKAIKVKAIQADEAKDKEIFEAVTQFNQAGHISNKTASEMAYRIAEEKIHSLILKY